VAPHDSADGRAQNRRIEISLAAPLSALSPAAQ
jgi:flagellar motor protein MotB